MTFVAVILTALITIHEKTTDIAEDFHTNIQIVSRYILSPTKTPFHRLIMYLQEDTLTLVLFHSIHLIIQEVIRDFMILNIRLEEHMNIAEEVNQTLLFLMTCNTTVCH